ncbi:hypothetical protein [Gorillibacterium sp. sgz5001074]|uniref:hypothetical protein n=1 Tax=Gorillibacterium sp. sgz5001074 TaxID=3446695 RepID=UPI003F6703C6
MHVVFNDGTWRRLNGDGTWTTLVSGLSTTAEWSFTNFQGNLADINLIGSNGVDRIKRYDGASVVDLADSPVGGNYITSYQNRLWCIVGTELRASTLDNPTEWSVFATPTTNQTKGYGKDLESPTGEKANALIGGLSKLTIGFPSSIVELFGNLPSDFMTKPASYDVGVMNNKAALTIEGIMHFYNRKGLYQYAGGTDPASDFSEVIQYHSDVANTAARALSCVGSDGKMFYASIPSAGAAAPDTILAYDLRREVSAWYVWKDIKAACFVRMGNSFYIGDAQGRVLKMGGITDNGIPISWHWISKAFSASSLSQVLLWLSLWVTVDLPVGSTMNVFLSKSVSGDADWEPAGSVTGTGLMNQPIYIPPDKAANAKYIRLKLEGTGPMAIHEIAREEEEMPIY